MGSFVAVRLKGNALKAAKQFYSCGLKYTGKRTIFRRETGDTL